MCHLPGFLIDNDIRRSVCAYLQMVPITQQGKPDKNAIFGETLARHRFQEK